MSMQYPTVAACPFCRGTFSGVFFDTVEFEGWCSRHEEGYVPGNLIEDAGQKVILFQSGSSADGLCEHFVLLELGLHFNVMRNQHWSSRNSMSVNLTSPLIKKWDPDSEVIAYVSELMPFEDEGKLDQLGTENHLEEVRILDQSMYPRSDGDRRFEALGNVIYAKNVATFFDDIRREKEEAWGVA